MTLAKFEDIPIHECGEPLVDLSEYAFVLEPSYFNQGFSTESRMFLRQSVAEKLMEIQKGLNRYTFKIWDSFRPRSVQKVIYDKFWQELHIAHPDWDEEKLKIEVGVFVTAPNNPQRIPPHSTGGAVDLTLVDVQGKELDMGTTFDHFGPEAAPFYFEENAQNHEVQGNRKVLREAMLEAGFAIDTDEWWHFDYGNQRWALALGRSTAIFGEAEVPK
ncbi:MAG: D-alanyl-D-alanine dipeptidase [Candidatus Pacebacteria bacterium]|nr:D-alanyl-D-alanine dipeptidase [Candidatus Paceibacterota bacterium]MBP9832569.1 D-alanyl-D-alanine dipeptidase [Candidatus Paceibacterota bacterium]